VRASDLFLVRVKQHTAVVISIDRFPENRAPNRCLPFDRIGARHPGTVVLSGLSADPKRAGNLVLPFDVWPVGSSLNTVLHLGCTTDISQLRDSGNELRPGIRPGIERHAGLPGPSMIKR
jgi:hypothetical protein